MKRPAEKDEEKAQNQGQVMYVKRWRTTWTGPEFDWKFKSVSTNIEEGVIEETWVRVSKAKGPSSDSGVSVPSQLAPSSAK